ncbi:mannose-6-phosphate isomerase, class I [Actinoallomurus vinaceus]|uniref:mannose-6-phosphate isomerase n=1 Tax=Actinoallomurus vinaceus TaxID=1080074 RepID=A0ABP8UJQ4_9ACTN
MERLQNPVQEYAWGSHTVLADLLGLPSPTERPQAELWIGAHPAASSRLPGGPSLDEHIAADPEATLGPAAVARFGPRLPFLLKVLAIAAPLSLQVHPDREQAERGFAAEATPPGDPARNYKDDWPKPELLCALTDVHALCGMRDPGESAELLAKVPALRPVVDSLAAGDLRAAVKTLLTWPSPDEVVPEAAAVAGEPYASLAERYPADMGVILAMLMNEVRLAPGQAMYVPPRVPHAYLDGTAVELMAGSDNVLRAGLTPKHVDVPELLNIASFEPGRPDVLDPVRHGEEEVYLTPAPEFRLSRVDVADDAVLPAGGPQLLLCTDGRVELHRDGRTTGLGRGEAAFAEHRGGPIEATGAGVLFRATLPES